MTSRNQQLSASDLITYLEQAMHETTHSPPPSPLPSTFLIPESASHGFDLTYRFLRHEHAEIGVTKEQLLEYAVRRLARHYANNHQRFAQDLIGYLVDQTQWWEQRRGKRR